MGKSFVWVSTIVLIASAVGCGDSGGDEPMDAAQDAGGGDAEPGDAGPEDAGGDDAASPTCGEAGSIGGVCRSGTMCGGDLTCLEELTEVMGTPLTLGSAFGIPSGSEDPDNADEYLAEMPSDVPIGFAPGGQCSQACDPRAMDDGCGTCATCSTTIGGSDVWSAVGISAGSFDSAMVTSDAEPGICRLNCQYDPETRGGCPDGYTCDPSENVCVEACVDDSQCNVGWGESRTDGLVAYEVEGAPYTCNADTGRCEWEAPADAAVNSECQTNADCPSPGGICLLGGRCATVACADATGTMAGPIACEGACLGFGGNNGSVCLQPCNGPDECAPGQACSELTMALPSGETGVCFGACADDSECRSSERCREVQADDEATEADESLSVCEAICDPDPDDGTDIADAITCGSDEVCEQAEGEDHGWCVPTDQLCGSDDDCNGGQACRVVDADLLGRCVDGCTDGDCTGSDVCVIQDGSDAGVCRTPGGACGSSPTLADGSEQQPLLGDAQCPPDQECDATESGATGTCVDSAS